MDTSHLVQANQALPWGTRYRAAIRCALLAGVGTAIILSWCLHNPITNLRYLLWGRVVQGRVLNYRPVERGEAQDRFRLQVTYLIDQEEYAASVEAQGDILIGALTPRSDEEVVDAAVQGPVKLQYIPGSPETVRIYGEGDQTIASWVRSTCAGLFLCTLVGLLGWSYGSAKDRERLRQI
jgi:hypothetical protein